MSSHHPIYIANDHAGFELKEFLKKKKHDLNWEDLGSSHNNKVDYPIFAEKLCEKMKFNEAKFGVLICGSGQGMNIKANRYPHIRAALCLNPRQAELARSHNDANVLCLGARLVPFDEALQTLNQFLSTEFDKAHQSHYKRIQML